MLLASITTILALFLLGQIQDVAGAETCDFFNTTRPINITGSTDTKMKELLIDLSVCLDTHNMDPNGFYFTDSKKVTGLMLAAKAGFRDIVQHFVHHPNIDVDSKDDEGYTAALIAAEYGHAKTLNLLIDLGANIEHKLKDGDTALILAAGRGKLNAVKTLLKRGALVNRHGRNYDTALNADAIDKRGMTALHHAAYGGYNDIVKALLRKGADVNAVNSRGWSPLNQAATYGNTNTVRILLKGGAKVNHSSNTGAVDSAVSNGKCDAARLLKSHGAVFQSSYYEAIYKGEC